ncbi:MAG: Dabb family protein [Holosporaceae bacterium]|nr:MAG: Dabb family protein [Holosporaceae bacterium]
MINHIVLFRFKKSISNQEINQVFESIKELASMFPGISNFSWGKNSNQEKMSVGYEYALFLQFDSEETRTKYQQHPFNEKISKEIVIPALCTQTNPAVVFDFSCNDRVSA